MALRQFAVFMNAGSYVIRPKSSGPALIWRRSIARIVPSWIGSSYFFPVRLSTIVSVSAIRSNQSAVVFRIVRLPRVAGRFARDTIRAAGPPRQILELAALAAERPPRGIDGVPPAEHAQRRFRVVRHPYHCSRGRRR